MNLRSRALDNRWVPDRVAQSPERSLFGISLLLNLLVIVYRRNFVGVRTWENGEIARNLVDGLGFSMAYLTGQPASPTSVMAPFYPYFLAGVYAVFGEGQAAYLFVQLLQALTQAAAVVVLFRIAERLFNRDVAIVAGLLFAVFPDHVYAVTIVHQLTFSTLGILLLVYSVLNLRKALTYKHAAITGVVLGLSTLILPATLYFAPFIPLVLLLEWRWNGDEIGRTLGLIATVTLVSIATILPWTVRNYFIHDQFVLMKLVGWNFWRGNVPPAIETGVPNNLDDAAPAVQDRVRQMSEADADSYLLGLATEYVIAHPLAFVEKFIRSAAYFWWFPPVQDVQETQVNVLRKAAYFPVLLSTVAGVVLSWQNWREYVPIYSAFFGFTIGYSVFFILPRYRVPTIQPFMFVFAGYAVYRVLVALDDRRRVTNS